MRKILIAAIFSLIMGQNTVCKAAEPTRFDIAPVKIVDLPVTVNGQVVAKEFYVDKDVLMLPLRAVVEALGCTISWDDRLGCVTIENDDDLYKFYLSKGQYEKNETTTAMSNPMTMLNEHSFAPICFFENGMSLSVLRSDMGVNILSKAQVKE